MTSEDNYPDKTKHKLKALQFRQEDDSLELPMCLSPDDKEYKSKETVRRLGRMMASDDEDKI